MQIADNNCQVTTDQLTKLLKRCKAFKVCQARYPAGCAKGYDPNVGCWEGASMSATAVLSNSLFFCSLHVSTGCSPLSTSLPSSLLSQTVPCNGAVGGGKRQLPPLGLLLLLLLQSAAAAADTAAAASCCCRPGCNSEIIALSGVRSGHNSWVPGSKRANYGRSPSPLGAHHYSNHSPQRGAHIIGIENGLL